MKRALVANVYFEEELIGKPFRFHPILQYLPLLYREEGDLVLVDRLAEGCVLETPGCTLSPWGYSVGVAEFAKNSGLAVPSFSADAVKTVGSKLFCFERGFCLPDARFIENEADLLAWCRDVSGPKILRKLFGMTGRGHYIFDETPVFNDFPAIGEPFVARDFDFSTQWFLDDAVHFLGATHLINNPRGGYRATRVGDEREIFGSYYGALQEAMAAQKPLLAKARDLGFRGYCGIDAMVYNGGQLQPALEVNARRTMGQVALKVASKRGHAGEMFFSHRSQENAIPLLPVHKKNQKQLWFSSF
jgi:hypothetical protein